MVGKKGFIRIVEAAVAILLIAGVLLIVVNRGFTAEDDVSEKIYRIELSALRFVELDEELRRDVLEANIGENGVEWFQFDSVGLGDVKNAIEERIPEYLECEGKVCGLDKICVLDSYIEEDVYAQAVAITANLNIYNPKQLKLFCWEK
jgi:hypothetical protein